jgi:hypothetical protein
MTLELHLRIIGGLLLLLAMLNVFIPKRFGWGEELQRLTLFTRQVFIVHCFFIILTLTMMGLLTLVFAPALLQPAPLTSAILGGLAIFWLTRLVIQFFFYSPALWRSNRFNTAMHIVFSCAWVYFATVFTCACLHTAQ